MVWRPSVGIISRLALISCMWLLGVANPQTTSSPAQQSVAPSFTSTTDLVLVPVVVRQGKQHVTGLTSRDFRLFEDKRPQRIAFVKPTTAGPGWKRAGGDNLFSNELDSNGKCLASRLSRSIPLTLHSYTKAG